MSLLSGKKLLILGLLIVLLATIPAVLFLVSTQQQTKSKAAPATILAFQPAIVSTTVGQKFDVDIFLDPGTNFIISTNFTVTYDPTKLATSGSGLVPVLSVSPTTPGFPAVAEGPEYTEGKIFIHFSVGTNVTKAITSRVKIATVTFEAKAPTTTPIQIGFASPYAASTREGLTAQGEDNEISSANPATVTIGAGQVTPTIAPTAAPTPTTAPAAPTTAPVPTSPPAAQSQAPVCTGLTVDKPTTGTPPFTITFNAIGNHPSGTISKVTFNFGDAQIQDATQSGGLGTASVNTQIAHTYNNAGTYTATAIFTDSKGITSNAGTCTQTITVKQTLAAGPTTIPTLIPTREPIVSPGPGNVILGIGTVGAIFSIIGALIFFVL